MSAHPLFDSLFSGTPEPTGPPLSGKDLRDSGIQQALDHVLQVKADYVEKCLSKIEALERETLITSECLREMAGEPPIGCENSIAGILKRAASKRLDRKHRHRSHRKTNNDTCEETLFMEKDLNLMPISPRQQRAFNFIKNYLQSNGVPPTYQEIGEFFNYSSTATVHRIVSILESEGLITRKPHAWRCIRLVEQEKSSLAA